MNLNGVFEFLLLLGRPACGKSEFIDYMVRAESAERAARYHLGELRVVDDFVFLWRRFEEDDEREKRGLPRLVSLPADTGYRVADDAVWDLLIDDIGSSLAPQLAAPPKPGDTTLIEFSRGRQVGYGRALRRLSPQLLRRAAILYIEVTFEESWRRNLARYDAAKRDGILTHSVPRSEMERNYLTDDWSELTSGRRHGRVALGEASVPFVTMNNEPESTDPVELDRRYAEALDALWGLPG
jgi:hypothetical protein